MIDARQYGIVLLAAGGSRRMGRAKQLLPIQGKPLIRHVAEAALAAKVGLVVVVLGAEAEQVRHALEDLSVTLVINSDWQQGLSSSLRTGVQAALTQSPNLQAVIVSVADQPELSADHLQRIITRFEQGGCTAVASVADETMMPPILFDRSWFDKLCLIQGDIGARAILQQHPESVVTVAMHSAADLDTPEDYKRFLS